MTIVIDNVAHDQSITFRSVRDTSVPLYENDVPSFDHIILFAPETKCKATFNSFSRLH